MLHTIIKFINHLRQQGTQLILFFFLIRRIINKYTDNKK